MRNMRHSKNEPHTIHDVYQMAILTLCVKALLAVCLITLAAAWLLARATTHVKISLATTLTAAVTAIVTSCFLSIARKLLSSKPRNHQVPQSDIQTSEDER